MQCWKCKKEMDNANGEYQIVGVAVTISLVGKQITADNIEYGNKQLGKYADGLGGCRVAICYECYIDNLFSSALVVQHRPSAKT